MERILKTRDFTGIPTITLAEAMLLLKSELDARADRARAAIFPQSKIRNQQFPP